jgi:hypothetical protein
MGATSGLTLVTRGPVSRSFGRGPVPGVGVSASLPGILALRGGLRSRFETGGGFHCEETVAGKLVCDLGGVEHGDRFFPSGKLAQNAVSFLIERWG